MFNVQGLCPQTKPSKVPYIKDVLIDQEHVFFALTETWLDDNYFQAELDIDGYSMFRSDRQRVKAKHGRLSGGVCIYIRDDCLSTFEPVIKFSNGVVELLALYSKSINFCIIVIYRQPDQFNGYRSVAPHFKEALDEINEYLATIETSLPNIVFCGDFNIPNANWRKDVSNNRSLSGQEKKMLEMVNEFCINAGLNQFVNGSTHVGGNTLDLVFTNNEFLCHSISLQDVPRSLSHHKIIELNTNFCFGKDILTPSPPPLNGLCKYNFFHEDINWDNVKCAFESYNWIDEFQNLDVDSMVEKFIEITTLICSQHVPLRKTYNKRKNKVPRDRRILMRRRRKLNLQISNVKTPLERKIKLRQSLVQVEKDILKSHSKSKSYMEAKAVNSIKKNSKYFFSYANKLSKTASKVGPLTDKNGNVVTDSKDMADILAKQFCSVFSPQTEPNSLNYAGDESLTCTLCDFIFSVNDVKIAIKELLFNSAPGPDGVSAMLLKKCVCVLSHPLYLIYRACLDGGVVPKSFKIGNVTPLFKSGSRGLAVNYRPITLTSHLSKIFEKIVRNHILTFLEEHNMLNDSQHGFRRGRSCISQLIAHFENIIDQLEKGYNVDVVYLDFCKAFDKLVFNTLLSKLKQIGISGKLARWLHSFLTGRQQYVTVNGFRSFLFDVLSGVPQGSVLGPLLFIIFINDIDKEVVSSFLSSFADDTRISKGIKHQTDMRYLQEDLNKVYSWAEQNNMVLNTSKFERLQYGKNEGVLQNDILTSSGEILLPQENVKDLECT